MGVQARVGQCDHGERPWPRIGVPSICSSTQRPRFTGDVRVGFEVTVRMLACVSKPPRSPGCNDTRTNCGPLIGLPPGFAGFWPCTLPLVSVMP